MGKPDSYKCGHDVLPCSTHPFEGPECHDQRRLCAPVLVHLTAFLAHETKCITHISLLLLLYPLLLRFHCLPLLLWRPQHLPASLLLVATRLLSSLRGCSIPYILCSAPLPSELMQLLQQPLT